MITLKRTYEATIDDVWDRWTTKYGIESWWGPDGFAVEAQRLDLRAGGELVYAMTAVADEQIEFMRATGLPLTSVVRVAYTEIVPNTRLAYTTRTDFIPDVEPYDVLTVVELQAEGQNTCLNLAFDPMHDEHWTQMARMGRISELEKLTTALHASAAKS